MCVPCSVQRKWSPSKPGYLFQQFLLNAYFVLARHTEGHSEMFIQQTWNTEKSTWGGGGVLGGRITYTTFITCTIHAYMLTGFLKATRLLSARLPVLQLVLWGVQSIVGYNHQGAFFLIYKRGSWFFLHHLKWSYFMSPQCFTPPYQAWQKWDFQHIVF